MKHEHQGFDSYELMKLIKERCGLERFILGMGISERKAARLMLGADEFTQSEMLLTAKLLHLSNEEFNRCFFAV